MSGINEITKGRNSDTRCKMLTWEVWSSIHITLIWVQYYNPLHNRAIFKTKGMGVH